MNEHIIGTIREFETPNFRVIVDAIDDYGMDLSFDDTGEVRKKLDSGEYIGFCARARVILRSTGAELASDCLGGCIYESLEAFMDHKECGKQNAEYERKGESVRCGSYFRDMIRTVCSEAREALAEVQKVRVRK